YTLRTSEKLTSPPETKATLDATGGSPAVSADALLSFFTFGYVAGETAVFEGMRRVPPGPRLVVDAADAASRLEACWQWPQAAECDALPESEAIEQLRAELSEAVRIRLRSDVPLGAFLSGGVDSAAVLALMAKHSPRPVQTFTIGFGDPAYDELEAARKTARAFGADHHEWVVTPDCLDVAHRLAAHYDE